MFLQKITNKKLDPARRLCLKNTCGFAVSFWLVVSLVAMSLAPAIMVHAQANSQFEIDLTVQSNDVTPPSIPQNLSATAMSSSTINLSWDASTDNVGVDGYEVFRDSNFIATTSATSYQDTGLSPETTYAYTVRAFDDALNFSAHAATATAETLSGTSTPVADEPSGGGPLHPDSADPVITDLVVSVSQTEARITWRTTPRTQGTIHWGETGSYELGTVREIAFNNEHETVLNDLRPDTLYHFELIVETGSGKAARMKDQTFRTLAMPDTEPPANPSNFRAVGDATPKVELSWQNPADPDFADVRIVRSTFFPPVDIYDGKVVYEGSAQTAVDKEVAHGETYFYTIFARDHRDNYSSGAIAIAYVPTPTTPGEPTRPQPVEQDPFEELPDVESPYPEIQHLRFSDFDFIQDNRTLQKRGALVEIDGTKDLTIRLGYEKVPEVLKTIGVTLVDEEDRTFSFLLRINEEKTAYTATIAPLERSGQYQIRIVVVDFKNQAMKRIAGTLMVFLSTKPQTPLAEGAGIPYFIIFVPVLVAGIALLLFFLFWKRRKDEEEPAPTPLPH